MRIIVVSRVPRQWRELKTLFRVKIPPAAMANAERLQLHHARRQQSRLRIRRVFSWTTIPSFRSRNQWWRTKIIRPDRRAHSTR